MRNAFFHVSNDLFLESDNELAVRIRVKRPEISFAIRMCAFRLDRSPIRGATCAFDPGEWSDAANHNAENCCCVRTGFGRRGRRTGTANHDRRPSAPWSRGRLCARCTVGALKRRNGPTNTSMKRDALAPPQSVNRFERPKVQLHPPDRRRRSFVSVLRYARARPVLRGTARDRNNRRATSRVRGEKNE